MKLVRWTAVAALLFTVAPAQGGTIAPALQARMDRTAPDSPISVIVHQTEQAPVADLNRELKISNATRLERHRRVVVALQDASRTQRPLLSYLDERMRAGSVLGYTSYWVSNLTVVFAVKEEIQRIAARSDVDWVEANFEVSLIAPVGGFPQIRPPEEGGPRGIGITPGVRAIRAPEVWRQLGYTGAGRLVANLDTGVDGNHPALATRWRGYNGQNPWQECWLDVLGLGEQFPADHYGHGTHVMGTETGLGAATGDTVGIAWGAQWIACNAINQGVGSGFDQDIITAYQWYVDPDGNPNTIDDVPDVVQNSWGINEGFGGNPPYTDCDQRWWAVLDNAAAAGIVVTWSAGNEGSGPQTLRSPADRASTLFEAFSVGAVDATNFGWPYPIAGFSSRGPSGCNVPPEQKIKPEVVAPGVDVYSSVPGGGYEGGWDGTSMAGPHAAGIVGLIREANPNLDVDTIKQILMDTARDEGTAGEDNTYGWGFVDAYDAVLAATVGFGDIEGTVTNASYNNTPIQGARVKLVDLGNQFVSDVNGHYTGAAPAGTHLVEASHPAFRPDTAEVTLVADQLTIQDFSLTDITGPAITNVSNPVTTTDTVGPYPIEADVTDYSTVASVKLYYRVNGGGWVELPMGPAAAIYRANIPGMPAGTQIDYYVWAQDGIGLTSTSPADAPASFYSLFITTLSYAYQAEDPGDANWQLGAGGDNATTGLWIRDDPVGTTWNGAPVQPEDDHTPAPGVKCFVTGNGAVGGAVGDQDVDGGCTTLLSPTFDLSLATMAFVTYHRWYGLTGNSADDQFEIDVSSDGGTSWAAFERVTANDPTWRKVTLRIDEVVNLTGQIRFRFRACDLNSPGLVEAAIDDVSLETFTPNPTDVIGPGLAARTQLLQNQPNPFNPVTEIRFVLSNPAPAQLVIYDAAGRAVRTLVDRTMSAGAHNLLWDGRDDMGRPVGSGTYFYRLRAGAFEQSRRMTILK